MNNKLIVISGASGSGKTTLINRSLEQISELQVVTAITTRPPRQDELDTPGRKKCISHQQFALLRIQNQLCCINKVYNEYYAFLKEDIDMALRSGKVILEYSVSMISDIKNFYPDCLCIYVYADNTETVKEILRDRNNPRIRYQNDKKEFQFLNKNSDIAKIFFQNDFTEESISRFVALIRSL